MAAMAGTSTGGCSGLLFLWELLFSLDLVKHGTVPMGMWMKAAFAAMVMVGRAYGQNLVPNGSFEEFTECPDDLNQVVRATGWTSLCASPDYYNACSDTFLVDVPANAFGFQDAADGHAYIGCYTYYLASSTVREHLQARLSSPLVAGQVLYLSMKVAVGGFGYSWDGNYNVGFATRGVGMRFSVQPLGPGLHISNSSILYMDQVLQDTSDWVTLSREWIPDSAYEYIQIGNFFADSLCAPMVIDPGAMNDGSYAFIDDIRVSAASLIGIDELMEGGMALVAGLQGDELVFSIRPGGRHAAFTLLDMAGRGCWYGEMVNGIDPYRLLMSSFSSGAYYLVATDSSGARCSLKFLYISP